MLSENLICDESLPIYIENDGTSAAIGEFWYNRSQNRMNDFFYTYLDIKAGAGLVLDGKPRFGFTKNAARFLHLNIMTDDGEMDHVPNFVTLTKLYELLENDNILVDSPHQLLDLYEENNPVLRQWLDTSTRYLAQSFKTVEAMIDPEMFVFGGRLPVAIYEDLITGTYEHFLEIRMKNKEYVPLFVPGNDWRICANFRSISPAVPL